MGSLVTYYITENNEKDLNQNYPYFMIILVHHTNMNINVSFRFLNVKMRNFYMVL